MTPDALTAQALLNCLIREVAGPRRYVGGGRVLFRLPRSKIEMRAEVGRASAGLAPRVTGTADERHNGSWRRLTWRRLATLTARELSLQSDWPNPEFALEVAESHAAISAILKARAARKTAVRGDGSLGAGSRRFPGDAPGTPVDRFLASEQALVAGHRFHPAPKARKGAPGDWLPYAPEAGARFPLRFLAVREDVLADTGDTTALDRLAESASTAPPPGYRVLPAHPWQLELLSDSAWLQTAIRQGLVADLGPGSRDVVPTSSVRTVYDPEADLFCKFSLEVRLTNCVRVSSAGELDGAVELTRILAPVAEGLAARHPGTALLTEPGFRTVAAADKRCYEGLAVIVRDGIDARRAPGVTPVLAASLIEPGAPWPCVSDAVAWWEEYIGLVVPPVLDLLVTHGIVLEPHPQNVIIGLDEAGRPAQVFFRDLEGTKLVADRYPRCPPNLLYGTGRAWNRALYCLIVNHLDQVAAALASRSPDQLATETRLWATLREVLAKCAADLGGPPRLRDVLNGAPLPAKANLRVRWSRAPDREADYLPLPTPWSHG